MGNNMNELHILDLVSEMSISSLEILRLSGLLYAHARSETDPDVFQLLKTNT